MGDNAPVLKHAVGEGRLHRVDLTSVLEIPLTALAIAGGHPDWVAVRRTFNKEADRLATRALEHAFTMHPSENINVEEYNTHSLRPPLGWELSC